VSSNTTPPATPRPPAETLDIAYQRASQHIEESFITDERIARDIEFICRCNNRAGTRFMMACLLASLSDPNVDIRKPFQEVGGEGIYNGRDYDEDYVEPFVLQHKLPVKPTTSFLTPAFRTKNIVLTPRARLVGRPRALYQAVVRLINDVHDGRAAANDVLSEILRLLIIIREEAKHRVETLLATLKPTANDTALAAENIVTLIQQHLAVPRSARLPVLVVAAAYEAAQEHLREFHKPLHRHTAADKQTGALGDVEIALRDDNNVVTVYEMKAKRVIQEDIDKALLKLAESELEIDNYIFITTETIDEEVSDYAAPLHGTTGVEFVILDCISFLRHFLHLFYRIRMHFLEAYQNLVMTDGAVDQPLKEAFLSLRVATEVGVTQAVDEEE
jgi:rubrerythrin